MSTNVLTGLLRPGDTVVIGQGAAEPTSLVRQLFTCGVDGLTVFCGLSLGPWDRVPDGLRVRSYCAHGAMRRLADAGRLDLVPCQYGQLGRHFREGRLPADVVLLRLPPADADGHHSLGCTADYVLDAALNARAVVAEINDRMPRTASWVRLPATRITATVTGDAPLPDLPARPATAAERRVAAGVAALVPNGATVQLGIGAIATSVAAALRDHRELRVRSGLVGDWLPDLVDAGALAADPDACLTGIAVGSDRLYDFLRGPNRVRFVPMERLVDPVVDAFVAVNSALEVDLIGQVNAEAVGGRYVGTVGGQPEFFRAARQSRSGLAVVALAAVGPDGSSRIVARPTGPVTTAQSDVDLVVTEFGTADLRACSLTERIDRMLAIAAPEHRDSLHRTRPSWT